MQNLTNLNYLELTPVQILKLKFKNIQHELKNSKCIKLTDFREFVLNELPEWNTPEGWDRIKNTWYGKYADVKLTELMEQYQNILIEA